MIQDLVLVGPRPGKFDAKYATLLTATQREELREGLLAIRSRAHRDGDDHRHRAGAEPGGGGGRPGAGPDAPGRQRLRAALLLEPARARENSGHRFGEGLNGMDKHALTAFLATL